MRRFAARTQGGKIITHTASLLHGQGAFFQCLENTVERILDRAHDKTVEQRDPMSSACTGENASPGQETEHLQDRVKTPFPNILILPLRTGKRAGNTTPGILYGLVGYPARFAVTLADIPDTGRDVRNEGLRYHRELLK